MIEIKNAAFQYAGMERAGVKDINLSIPDGQCVLLCGASGCGKTTVTRLINGLIPHFYKGELSGDILINGHNVANTELYDLAGVVGSVFQNPRSQFFSVDTDGEIVFGPENIGIETEEIKKRKKKIVEEMGIAKLLSRSLFDLSGGEKQQIACASVAALLPEVIILDEPSSNLDWAAMRNLRDVMQKWKANGKTIIISEHRLWYVKDIIDRAVYMEDGQIREEWTKEEFLMLSSEDLAARELRPIDVEIRNMKCFMDENAVDFRDETVNRPKKGDVVLKDFYFTYNPRKHLLFQKRISRKDAEICTIRIPEICAKKGEIIGLIGKNGSGKSTFLRCLCGLEPTCIGSVETGGKTYDSRKLTKICYMVMQDVNHQLFTDSVFTEVMLSMEKPDETQCDNILKSLDLYQYREKHPLALSGGQKQRVAIASAIAAKAQILLFDEPTSGLDYRHMKEVAHLLRKLADQGKTVFVSTHDPEFAMSVCDRIIRITEGRAKEIM